MMNERRVCHVPYRITYIVKFSVMVFKRAEIFYLLLCLYIFVRVTGSLFASCLSRNEVKL